MFPQKEYNYPKLDSLEAMILSIGPGALMWKRDLERYFLQLPLDPVDYLRSGFIWRQNFFFFIAYGHYVLPATPNGTVCALSAQTK